MLKVTESTVFNTGADCIVNTINCVGFMGKGIALEFALRYPKLEEAYISDCKKRLIHTGQVYFYEIDGQKIINFPTKFHFKYPSQMIWIEQGLEYFVNNYKKWGIKSVAFPLLGANNGGLNKAEVEELMQKYLSSLDIDVYICHSTLLEGKELEMVNKFRDLDFYELRKYVRLSDKQLSALKSLQPNIRRFVNILETDGIGITKYKEIFQLLYNGNIEFSKQCSLFD